MNPFNTQPKSDKKPLFRISGWLTQICKNLGLDGAGKQSNQQASTMTSEEENEYSHSSFPTAVRAKAASVNKTAKFTTTSETENENLFSFLPNAVGGNGQRAFTLIEVLVAMTVITIVSSVVFTQRQTFNQSVGLNNVAQEVALAIRQTQNYGVSSRGSDLEEDVDDFAYGIVFSSSGSSNDEFIMYRDRAGNEGFNPSDLEIETYSLPAGVFISGVCTNVSFGVTSCSSNNSQIVIRFSRPHPNAEFRRPSNGQMIEISGDEPETAVILLEEEESGSTRRVVVRRSGFITVE